MVALDPEAEEASPPLGREGLGPIVWMLDRSRFAEVATDDAGATEADVAQEALSGCRRGPSNSLAS